jgi:predicted 2-oxoglutarate/Fe(II)-dependent dioxygenase YbiX/peroxiredoxin
MGGKVDLEFGDQAPWFAAATTSNPQFRFDTVAGRYAVLCFFGSAVAPGSGEALETLLRHPGPFDGDWLVAFGVSVDPADLAEERVTDVLPGVRIFWDFDRAVSTLYGAFEPGESIFRGFWLVLDPTLRVLARLDLGETERLTTLLAGLPTAALHAATPLNAPVLITPRVFEPDFCRALIGRYEQGEVQDSGFMRELAGRTTPIIDHAFKRRSDHTLKDEAMMAGARARIVRRLAPEIRKAFQFRPTRMERYLVACYDAGSGGWFRPHRDNTTAGTAHRRFAVTINLNAEDYEGGDLRFPEFGERTYRAPTGGAAVFSCSLLHEALPVTRGRRYAFLPFLYDEAAAEQREAANAGLAPEIEPYVKQPGPAP